MPSPILERESARLAAIPTPHWTPFQFKRGDKVIGQVAHDPEHDPDRPWIGTVFQAPGKDAIDMAVVAAVILGFDKVRNPGRVYKEFETFEEACAWVETKCAALGGMGEKT